MPVYAGLLPPLADEAQTYINAGGQPDAIPTIIGPADSYTADASATASVWALLLSRGRQDPPALTPALCG